MSVSKGKVGTVFIIEYPKKLKHSQNNYRKLSHLLRVIQNF